MTVDAEQRIRLLIDSIRDYAIFMLDEGGHVSSWNVGAQRIKGWTAQEIIGQHFSIFYPDAPDPRARCAHELEVARETGRFEEEGWRVRNDGSQFWANVVISAVRDSEGKLVGFGKVTRDLTERRAAEQQRAELIVSEQANRTKDEFLAMLGHELRNPLAPIVSALGVMKVRGEVWTKEHIVIERQLQHVVRLVGDLLDVARIRQRKVELKQEVFEIADVITRALEISSPLIEQRRHALVVDVPPDGLPVRADLVRLSQVFGNLVNNAAKYTPPNGEIRVTAIREGDEVVVRIRDNGVGIAPHQLRTIFDLFAQAGMPEAQSHGGLGIGLSLVRSLLDIMGGTVTAYSDGVGRGSEFTVRLPRTDAGVRAPTGQTGKLAPVGGGHLRRVLVVDDNVDAADLLAELLRMLGHEVSVAHDGPSALASVARFTPEIAILDIGLPGMSGLDLAKRLRSDLGERVRLIALSGYGQTADRERSEAAGFDEHLVKPIDVAQVTRLLQRDVAA